MLKNVLFLLVLISSFAYAEPSNCTNHQNVVGYIVELGVNKFSPFAVGGQGIVNVRLNSSTGSDWSRDYWMELDAVWSQAALNSLNHALSEGKNVNFWYCTSSTNIGGSYYNVKHILAATVLN